MSHAIKFTHGGREWYTYQAENEAHTRFITLVKPVLKGPPFPTREEYRAARKFYHQQRRSASGAVVGIR